MRVIEYTVTGEGIEQAQTYRLITTILDPHAASALELASVFLREGFIAHGFRELGAVRLAEAHIGGHLDCTGATIRNSSGPPCSLAASRPEAASCCTRASPPTATATRAWCG